MPSIKVELEIPKTKSPVPGLCSVHAEPGRGDFGDPAYRGNCSGLLIRDLFNFYRPKRVLDPMEGGGTVGDVARSMEIDYQGFDLKRGQDAMNPKTFEKLAAFDLIWIHPPYHDLIPYTGDPRCLSRCTTLTEFLAKLHLVIRNCLSVLKKDGYLAILIGDITRQGRYYALPFHVWRISMMLGLELACPEIIRLSHGATSTAKTYDFSFIPRVHDVCLVLRRRRSNNKPR